MVDLIEPTESPESPLSPLSPEAPTSPVSPEAGSFLDGEPDALRVNTEPTTDTDFFTEFITKSRRKKYEQELEAQRAEADQIFGQDGLTVTDTKKFIEAMEDLESFQSMAEEGLGYVDVAYSKYLEFKFGVGSEQADLMSSYFKSGSYVPGVSPEDLKFIPGYKTATTTYGPLQQGATETAAVLTAPLPPLDAQPFTGPLTEAQNAMREAAKVGKSAAELEKVGKDALAKSEKAISAGVKAASVAAAVLSINEFIKDPSILSGVGAGAATAQAAASFGVSGASAAASALGPAALFLAGASILSGLLSDKNYMRSEGSIGYNSSTGKFETTLVRGSDAGSTSWMDGQQAVILSTINELTDKYGFEIDPAGVKRAFQGGHLGKSYITNSVSYAKQGGRNASFSGQDYVLNLISSGALKAGENTDAVITKDPEAFVKFMGELNTKMQDKYASYMWQNYDGVEVNINKSRTNRKGYKGYAAFGSETAAKAQASVLDKKYKNPSPVQVRIRSGKAQYRTKYLKTTEVKHVVRRRTERFHDRQQIALGEFEIVPQYTSTYTDLRGNPLSAREEQRARKHT